LALNGLDKRGWFLLELQCQITEPCASMKKSVSFCPPLLMGGVFAICISAGAGVAAELDRTVLPIHEPEPPVIEIEDAREAKAPPRFAVTAPEGAPNVVIVLIDDIGFGHSSAFGGPVRMPTLEKMAGRGLKYNRFHTTALCSPTRVALLTGHNHHANNAGAIMELATAYPGNTGVRPREITTLAEILKQNGFSTAAFGKYHETPPWEVSVSGPHERWPTGSGFEKFYGFIGGETNQWAPAIYDGVTRVEHRKSADYHFTTDLADQAIRWVSAQQSLTPDKPFYLYFAPGATHAPHHAPKEWIAKYKGEFAGGWDKLREETFARQKQLGVIPAGTQLTPRPAEIPAWEGMSAEQKRLFERQMETFAGFGEHTDNEVGRLVAQLETIGELENTLFFYIVGDNGASAEGGPEGTYNEMMALNGVVGKAEQMMAHLDTWGGPTTYPHFAIGWAWAGNTPFQWTKQVASHFGGTRNGMVMHWPKGIKAGGGAVRSQFHHVVDVAPTVLEAAKIPQPKEVAGVKQRPMDGVSMLYSVDAPEAPERHKTQYFEMFGNRGIYHEGWVACTRHSIPWLLVQNPPLKGDVWELYHVDEDFSEARNLAGENPEKLKELQAVFAKEAVRNHVFPIDDRRSERFNAAIAGRPDLMGGRKTLTVYPGMTGMMENAFINVKSVAHTITAEIEVPEGKANGVVIAQAGYFGGWTLYLKDGKPHHEYNWFALERTNIGSDTALTPGKHMVRYEFVPDAARPGTGGKSVLSVDGKQVAEGHIPKTQPFAYSGDEGADVGVDGETNVSPDYPQDGNEFTGTIKRVTIEVK
jgi:arylsulfatase